MSGLYLIAFLVVIFAQATQAEVALRKGNSAQLFAFRNLPNKLAAMEDYSAVYVKPGRPPEVLRPFPKYHQRRSSMPLVVIMRPRIRIGSRIKRRLRHSNHTAVRRFGTKRPKGLAKFKI